MTDTASPLLDSLALAAERIGNPTPQVYARLFTRHPEVEPLFAMDTDGGVRGSMLSQAFDCLIDLAGKGEMARTILQAEHANHQAYHVVDGMFEIFFSIMRDVVREAAGADWSPAMATAWENTLDQAASLLTQQA